MRKLACMLLLIGQAPAWALPITVSFEPESFITNVGDTIDIDIIADIPEPVLGWGLDVTFDAALLGLVGSPVIGPAWLPAVGADGDALAGLAFPVAATGDAVLLATLTFSVLDSGSSMLAASATGGDLSEGFALVTPGAFADTAFEDASVSAVRSVPEPATVLLMLAGLAACAVHRPPGRTRRPSA